MKKHVNVYIYATITAQMFNLQDSTIIQTINKELGVDMSQDQLNYLRKHDQPKTVTLVHALKSLGFQPLHISKLLDIHSATVSYHLRNEKVPGYTSHIIASLISHAYNKM